MSKINWGEYNPAAAPPPRVSPERVKMVLTLLTVGGFLAIAADCWMSWEGFQSLPIDWWIAACLTGLVALAQLGSGVIQGLGGNPFKGVGGSSGNDGIWGLTLRALYGLDIFSNFAGFGGTQYLSFGGVLRDPLGTLGMILWFGILAVLLAFGDEILFRLRDRIAIGSQRNQQLAKMRAINLKAHNRALKHYETRALSQAEQSGQQLDVTFDWMKQSDV
jgi:hypothetical protein